MNSLSLGNKYVSSYYQRRKFKNPIKYHIKFDGLLHISKTVNHSNQSSNFKAK